MEGEAVFRIAKNGGNEAPGLNGIWGNIFLTIIYIVFIGPILARPMHKVANRFEISELIRGPTDGFRCRQFFADILDGLVVAGGNENFMPFETFIQTIELEECARLC